MAKKAKEARKAVVYGLYDGEALLYIGSTVDPSKRYSAHIEGLASGKHANKTFQKYVNEHPGLLPEMRIVHTCKDDSTVRKFIAEIICIDIYRPKCNRPIIQYNMRTSRNIGFPKVPFDKGVLEWL